MTAAALHGALLQVWAEVSPSPSPSTLEIPPEDQTSPGLLGFLVTFAAALAVMALGYSLVRKLRKVERRGQQLEADERAATEQSGTQQSGIQQSADEQSGAQQSAPDRTPTERPQDPDVR
ncbi:hypothetical protein [Cellulomonas taurus]|uniref:hypothetical protein n=1 Tax=Cellulomonas taurus TaxID=2729175 RepID=UPI00145E7B54|nr:hypothetical protein [Cellulomonas taurus]